MQLSHQLIILLGTQFGSIYLFSIGLKNINDMKIKTGKINKGLLVLNSSIMLFSGITFGILGRKILKKY